MKSKKCETENIRLIGMPKKLCQCEHLCHQAKLSDRPDEAYNEAHDMLYVGWVWGPCPICRHDGWHPPVRPQEEDKVDALAFSLQALADLKCPSCGDNPDVDCPGGCGG